MDVTPIGGKNSLAKESFVPISNGGINFVSFYNKNNMTRFHKSV